MRKVLLAIVISLIIAQIGYLLVEGGIKKFNCFSYTRLNEIINGKINYDVVFFGSSRTQCHLNPCIIDSIISLNTYNAGKAGANSLEVKMLLQAYLLKHKAPKYIFYNIDALTVTNVKVVPNPSLYLFFLENEPIATNLVNTFDRVYLLKRIPFMRLLYFDDYLRNISIQGYKSKNELLNTVNYCKGHASNPQDTIDFIEFKNTNLVRDVPDLTEIKKIITICNQNEIKLIFHSTPIIFINGKPTSNQNIQAIDELAKIENIPFIRFDTSKFFSKYDFIDFAHLNKLGAEKYSRLFAKFIKCKIVH